MNAKKVRSGRTGRKGWQYRFTDPVTRMRTHKTMWVSERREADGAFDEYLKSRERLRRGHPENDGWELPYSKLVARFAEEAPIASEDRRAFLESCLLRNSLRLRVGVDLAHLGKLTAGCKRLLSHHADTFVIRRVQEPLKQLTRWAASIGLFPYDPLAFWKRLPRRSEMRRRRAFLPDEMREILSAAEELDRVYGRQFPTSMVLKTLLLTGNRPSAVFAATVNDLEKDRLVLPPGNGKKRNGAASLPPEFVKELREAVATHGAPKPNERLLRSQDGGEIDRCNFRKAFVKAMTLAYVRLSWPKDGASNVKPLDVAHAIFSGRPRGFDGPPPKDKEKLAARKQKITTVEALIEKLRPEVEARMRDRDMYALRKTHISWARQLVNPDSVRVQVGHAAQDTEERHYLDLVDPHVSSKAVWDVLRGVQQLTRGSGAYQSRQGSSPVAKLQQVDLKVDLVDKLAEKSNPEPQRKIAQVIVAKAVCKNIPGGTRTHDLRFRKPALYPSELRGHRAIRRC